MHAASAGNQILGDNGTLHPAALVVATWPAVTYASTTAEETIFDETIPAGLMNATGELEWILHHTWLNNSSVNRSFLLLVYIGGVVKWQDIAAPGHTLGTTTVKRTVGPMVMRFKNTGATNTNEFTFGGPGLSSYVSAATTGEGTIYIGAATTLPAVAGRNLACGIDTASAFNIKITVTMSASASTITGEYAGGCITYRPGV